MKASVRTCADPVGQRLRLGRLGVGVTGGTHRRAKDLRRTDLTAAAIDHLNRLAGVIDAALAQLYSRRK